MSTATEIQHHGTISFIQSEHSKMLASLHKEIETLQLRCSDLQVELSSSYSQAKSVNGLLDRISKLEKDNDEKEQTIKSLTSSLQLNLARVKKLEEQLSWNDVQFQNKLQTQECKLSELRQNLALNQDLTRLKDDCKKIYEQSRQSAKKKIDQVADLARRAPISEYETDDLPQPIKHRSFGGDEKVWRTNDKSGPISFDSRASIENRSKVFRHRLQRIYSLDMKDCPIDSMPDCERSTNSRQSMLLFSFENPPLTIPMSGYQRQQFSSLPSSSSRFPPLVPAKRNVYEIVRNNEDSADSTMGSLSLTASMNSVGSGILQNGFSKDESHV